MEDSRPLSVEQAQANATDRNRDGETAFAKEYDIAQNSQRYVEQETGNCARRVFPSAQHGVSMPETVRGEYSRHEHPERQIGRILSNDGRIPAPKQKQHIDENQKPGCHRCHIGSAIPLVPGFETARPRKLFKDVQASDDERCPEKLLVGRRKGVQDDAPVPWKLFDCIQSPAFRNSPVVEAVTCVG
jgi:hypothetical protein